MNTYTSTTKVIDTTKPVIEVKYANESPVNTMTDVEIIRENISHQHRLQQLL